MPESILILNDNSYKLDAQFLDYFNNVYGLNHGLEGIPLKEVIVTRYYDLDKMNLNSVSKDEIATYYYRDKDGNIQSKPYYNAGAGYLNGTDPVGKLYVEGVATTPVFRVAGETVSYLGGKVMDKILPKIGPKLSLNIKGRMISSKMNPTESYYMDRAEVPIEDKYLYHTGSKGKYHIVKNHRPEIFGPRKYLINLDNSDKAMLITGKDGKLYTSTVPESKRSIDRIWWDKKGHNTGNNVWVMKEETMPTYKTSDPLSLARPDYGAYQDSYRITLPPDADKVVRFKYEPIGNTYIPISPYRKITTNKMSLEELFTPD